jgi:hypothetical protein
MHTTISLVELASTWSAGRNNSSIIIIIINPCKPYHFGIGTAPHPLGRWRVD